ncbi:MAG: aminotransferase class III-fold pyridoxal phosphate-dependent enzyme [Parachlamydiaceae bacterium]|nr:aminotransferase class III-fold pyridoxal phosphate-dependent enzyme [Parachlamydiaceae bacterium]
MKKDPFASLAAEALATDPRIEQAKKLLLEAVKAHQKGLTEVKPANPALKQQYDELLAVFAECRGSKLWFPYIGSGIGHGPFVELMDGSVKYDFINGIGPHYLGHSHPALISASIDAALSDTIMQGQLQQNYDSVELVTLLCQASKMEHCFLTTSGAMANDNALKIAFQKRYPAYRVLAFDHNFSGRSLALTSVTDKPAYREGIPPFGYVDYVPFFDATNPEESTQRAVEVLQKHLSRHPKEYAVMCFELVQGEGGFYPGSKEFFTAIMRILKENNVSIFIDEIQTFGRTPALFAFQYFGLEEFADIVSIGKLTQVCATLFNKDHRPRPGLLSQTFTGSTSAIRAAKVILHELIHGNYYGPEGKIAKLHLYFAEKLAKLSKRHPKLIQGPFGVGAMIAFTPFDGNAQRTTQFIHDLFQAGVMSFIAGNNPSRVRFLIPAGIVTTKDIDAVVDIIETTLTNETMP